MQLSQILKTFRVSGTLVAEFFCSFISGGASYGPSVLPTFGATVVINTALANAFIVEISTNAAFAINASNIPAVGYGQVVTVTFKNTSGGAHGTGTFGAMFKMISNTLATIATANNRTYQFVSDGTNLIQIGVAPATDVPN